MQLFLFLLLVLADNALARAASQGNTVPVIRTAFHIGSHYELYQAEGVNPTVFSYIVGDVTIELARIIDKALPGQVMLGDFGAGADAEHGCAEFLRQAVGAAQALAGLPLMGLPLKTLRCWLSRAAADGDGSDPLQVSITDKHGLKHCAFNLQAQFEFEQRTLDLGLTPERLRDGFE